MNYRINYFDRGHFGDFTIYTKKNGQVIIRIRRNRGGKGIKTFKTQCIRVRLANLVRLWQVLGALLKNAFSDKEERQSDFNRFIQLNFEASNIYLDRSESRKGVTIGTNVVVSSGHLPPISFTDGTMQWISDICVGDLVLDQNATIGELTTAIVTHNGERFLPTDDLFVLQLKQLNEPYEDYDYCQATNDKLELDQQSRVRVLDKVVAGGLTTVTVDGQNYLALPSQEGLFTTMIHSRTMPNDHVLCSFQTLLGKSQAQREYSSDQALLDAIISYGGVDDENFYRRGTERDPLEELRRKIAESGSGGTTGGGPGTVATYTITPRVEPDASFGTITMVPSQMPVPAGTQVRLTATPAGGKRLDGWSTGSTEATITVTVTGNQTVTATFATIATGGGGNGLGSKEM